MDPCSRCGAPLRDNARFCDSCGTPVQAVAAGPPLRRPAADAPAGTRPLEGMRTQQAVTPILVVRRSMITYLLHPLPWLLWGLLIAAAAVTYYWREAWYAVPAALVLAAGSLAVWWVHHRGDHLTVYADRIVRHEGVLNRTEVVNPLWRVQNVTIKQKWYGFGWIYIETAGEDSDQGFGPTREAAHVRDVIYHLMRPQE